MLDVWDALPPRNFPNYPAGTWGPKEADELLERDGRRVAQDRRVMPAVRLFHTSAGVFTAARERLPRQGARRDRRARPLRRRARPAAARRRACTRASSRASSSGARSTCSSATSAACRRSTPTRTTGWRTRRCSRKVSIPRGNVHRIARRDGRRSRRRGVRDRDAARRSVSERRVAALRPRAARHGRRRSHRVAVPGTRPRWRRRRAVRRDVGREAQGLPRDDDVAGVRQRRERAVPRVRSGQGWRAQARDGRRRSGPRRRPPGACARRTAS